jgi:hypothetical protein
MADQLQKLDTPHWPIAFFDGTVTFVEAPKNPE